MRVIEGDVRRICFNDDDEPGDALQCGDRLKLYHELSECEQCFREFCGDCLKVCEWREHVLCHRCRLKCRFCKRRWCTLCSIEEGGGVCIECKRPHCPCCIDETPRGDAVCHMCFPDHWAHHNVIQWCLKEVQRKTGLSWTDMAERILKK